jgi:hypothetical protein
LDLDATTPSSSQPSVSLTAGIKRKTDINTELLITTAQSSAQNMSERRRVSLAAVSNILDLDALMNRIVYQSSFATR